MMLTLRAIRYLHYPQHNASHYLQCDTYNTKKREKAYRIQYKGILARPGLKAELHISLSCLLARKIQ